MRFKRALLEDNFSTEKFGILFDLNKEHHGRVYIGRGLTFYAIQVNTTCDPYELNIKSVLANNYMLHIYGEESLKWHFSLDSSNTGFSSDRSKFTCESSDYINDFSESLDYWKTSVNLYKQYKHLICNN